jgi:flagellar protein FlaG
MSRIEATVATQVGDASRPRQAVRDSQLQVEKARSIAVQAEDPRNESIKSDDMRAVVQQLKQVIEAASGRSLDFYVDDEAKLSYVTVRDQKSGEVIRQIPSEEVRQLKARIDAMIGLLFDKRA